MLKPSYVIFLCLFDYFEMDQPIYFFQSYDINLRLILDDQRYIIIINSKCSEENRPEELRDFFSYINGILNGLDNISLENSITDEWVRSIHRKVIMLNEDPEVRKIMTLEEDWKIRTEEAIEAIEEEHEQRLEEVRKESREEGLVRGREEGLVRGREEGKQEGRKEGREEGLVRGREEGKQETALKMKSMGLSEDIISEATGLTVEEIRKL